MGQINKVKTAVIGCGMISTIYLKNMTNMFEILDVVAICDRHEEKIRRQAEAFHIEKVMTIEEICESDESVPGRSSRYIFRSRAANSKKCD